jgi:hypothetical protein
MDPKHPLKIGEDYYPDASKRANEEGRCIVLAHVAATAISRMNRFRPVRAFRAWMKRA